MEHGKLIQEVIAELDCHSPNLIYLSKCPIPTFSICLKLVFCLDLSIPRNILFFNYSFLFYFQNNLLSLFGLNGETDQHTEGWTNRPTHRRMDKQTDR